MFKNIKRAQRTWKCRMKYGVACPHHEGYHFDRRRHEQHHTTA